MEKIRNLVHNKKFIMLMMFSFVCIGAIFAGGNDSSSTTDTFGLNTKVQILVDLISSPWVKGIACIALIVECIGLITAGRQEPGMFKKFIPWIAGTIIFMAAGTIKPSRISRLIFRENDFTNECSDVKPASPIPSKLRKRTVNF